MFELYDSCIHKHAMLSGLQGMELSNWSNVTTIQLVLLKGYFYKIGRHSNVIRWSQPFSNSIILVFCISNLWMQLFTWQFEGESLHPPKIQYLNPLFQMSFVIVKKFNLVIFSKKMVPVLKFKLGFNLFLLTKTKINSFDLPN